MIKQQIDVIYGVNQSYKNEQQQKRERQQTIYLTNEFNENNVEKVAKFESVQ